jgi:ATP/maltotriose-dependent transcriptional regulator MalT
VPRAHLTERLQQGAERALTLVSAPAGFGKTTLLAQWLMESGMPVAWLSLEADDNDPTRFLSYLIAALHTHEALATLDALAQVAERRHFAPHLVTQGTAVRAEIELAQGNVAAAIRWADSSGLSTEDDDLHYPREGEYLALARVRIAQGRADPAALFLQDVLHLLDRLH